MNTDIFTTKKLKTLVDMRMGPTVLQKDLSDNGLPVFSAGNQEHPWGYTNKNVIAFNKGILVISARGTIGVPKLPQFDYFTCTQTTIAIQPKKELDVRYLYYFLQSVNWDSIVSGVATPMLTISILGEIDIILPSIEIQRRIVSKLDAFLPQIRLNRSRIEKISTILKRFRQSVISAACSGSLIESFNEYDFDKWAEVRILLNDRKNRINGLPSHWVLTNLGNLCDGFQYGTSKKSEASGLVPVLRMGNLQNGEVDWSGLKYSSDKSDMEKYALSDGDVLFNRTNSPDLVGKTSIYRGQGKAIFAGYLIRIRNKKDVLLSEYLTYCLNSNYGRKWREEVRTDGVGQSNINATVLASFPVPLPPIDEQKEIIKKAQQLLKIADSIESRHQKAMVGVDLIERSILNHAFKGELTERK